MKMAKEKLKIWRINKINNFSNFTIMILFLSVAFKGSSIKRGEEAEEARWRYQRFRVKIQKVSTTKELILEQLLNHIAAKQSECWWTSSKVTKDCLKGRIQTTHAHLHKIMSEKVQHATLLFDIIYNIYLNNLLFILIV